MLEETSLWVPEGPLDPGFTPGKSWYMIRATLPTKERTEAGN